MLRPRRMERGDSSVAALLQNDLRAGRAFPLTNDDALPAFWPVIPSERLRLVSMPLPFIEAVLDGDRDRAASLVGFALPDDWPDARARRTLSYRRDQLRANPSVSPWLLRAMLGPRGTMIGYINFHGPPASDASNELGYTVLPAHRRQGYATEAIRALMAWAAREQGVRRFLLSISPENEPSLALARKLGFREVGSRMDAEDGLELVFELRGWPPVDTSDALS